MPLLEYGDSEIVIESEDVIKYIGQNLSDGHELYPIEPAEQSHVEKIIRSFDNVIQGYYKLLSAKDESEAQAGKEMFCNEIKDLDSLLSSGPCADEGPFCLGGPFSVAECYAAPWLHRFSLLVPYFRDTSMSQLTQTCDRFASWMDAVLARPSVTSTSGSDAYLIESTKRYFVSYCTPNSPADKAENGKIA